MNHPSYWLSRWLAATPEMGNALHDGPGQRHDQQQRGSDAPPGQSNTHACALYTLQPLLHTRSGWRATLEMVMRGDTNAGLNSESSQVPAGLGVAVIRGVSAALPLAMATIVSTTREPAETDIALPRRPRPGPARLDDGVLHDRPGQADRVGVLGPGQ